jgi:phage regulator Rha-like protein
MSDIISNKDVEEKIISIRGQNVLLDRDVAELYGVETKRINESVKNNPDKFPDGYIILMQDADKIQLVENFDRFSSLKHATVLPTAFTEKGLYMLATILKSKKATDTTIAIVETFARMREFVSMINQLPEIEDESRRKDLMNKTSDILGDLMDDNFMEVTGDEISFELDLAVIKVKRTIKREKRESTRGE